MDDRDFLNLVGWVASLPVSSFASVSQGDNARRGDNTQTRLQAVENAKIQEAARHRNALSKARGEGRAEIQAKLDNALREATMLRAALNTTRAHLNGNPFVAEANAIWDRIMRAIQRQAMPQADRGRLVAAVTRAKDRVLDMTLAIALYLKKEGMRNGEIATLGLRLLHESDRATAEQGRANRLQTQLDSAREDVRLREATVAQLQADARALEENIAELRGEAGVRGAELAAANQRHAEAEARVADAERRLTEAQDGHAGHAAGLRGTISALQGQLSLQTEALERERNALAAARAEVAARDVQIRQQTAELERLRGRIERGASMDREQRGLILLLAQSRRAVQAAAEEVQRLQARVNGHQEENAALVRALEERNRELAQGSSAHAPRVSALEAEIASLQEDVRNLQAERLRAQGVMAAALAVATSKEAELRGKNELIRRMEAEMAKGRGEIEALERRVLEKNARIQELQGNLDEARRGVETLRQNVATAEENLRSKEVELRERLRELDEARADASLCKEQMADLKEQIRVLKESEGKHDKEISVLSSNIGYHSRKLASLEEQRSKAADEIRTLNLSLQKATVDRNAANESNRQLSDQIESLRREMNDTSTAIAGLRSELARTQQELDTARDQKALDDAHVEGLDATITSHETTIRNLNTQLDDLRRKQGEDGSEIERLTTRLRELEGGNVIQTLQKEVEDLKRQINDWEEELGRVSELSSKRSSELADKEQELERKQQELDGVRATIDTLSTRLKECDDTVIRLEQERQQILSIHQFEIQGLKDELEQLREKLAEAERAQSTLNKSHSSLATNLSESLENVDAIRSKLDDIRDLVKASADARSRLSDFERNSQEDAANERQSLANTVEETDAQLSEAIKELENAQEGIRHQEVDIVRSMTERVVSLLGSMASLVNSLPSADVSREALRVSRAARKTAESDLKSCEDERRRLLAELQAYRDNPSQSIGLFATAWENAGKWDQELRVLDQSTVSDILTRANKDWKRVYNIGLTVHVQNPYTIVNTYLHMSLECTRNIVTERGRREARKIFHERFREHFQRLNMVASSHWSHVLDYIRTGDERTTKRKHEQIITGDQTFDHIKEENPTLLVAMKYADFIRFQFCAEIMHAHSGKLQTPIFGHKKSTDAARRFFCNERKKGGSELKAQHLNRMGRNSLRSQTDSRYVQALVKMGWKMTTPWHGEDGQGQFYDGQRDVLDLFVSPSGTPEDEEYKELKARFGRQASGEGTSGA